MFFSSKCRGDVPSGLVMKNLPSNAEDMGSVPGQGTKMLQQTPRAANNKNDKCENYAGTRIDDLDPR